MSQGIHRKIRPDAVWAEVRKAWEEGETARSVAARYDVGVHALWKRREAEGWKRPEPTQGPIEPAEGWDRYIQARRDAFTAQLEDARALADCLAAAMTDERLSRAPHWHIPWLYHWRATHLGLEATARDRARAIETQCYLLAANQGGSHPGGRETFGHSAIIDPWGRVLVEQEQAEGVLLARRDSAAQAQIRHSMPVIKHRRFSTPGAPRPVDSE